MNYETAPRDLKYQILINYSRSVAGKLIEIKKTTRKPFHKPPSDIKDQLTRPFAIASNNTRIG